jgi:hypothetical protein
VPPQSRVLNIISQTMRGVAPDPSSAGLMESWSQRVCGALLYLFRTAPDSIVIRRELLGSTRYMLSGPYKGVCFAGVVPEVLAEGVLMGSPLASMETLKPMAVSGRCCCWCWARRASGACCA